MAFKNTKQLKMSGMDMRQVHEAIKRLAAVEVLVGIPESTAERDDDAPINNATIGFLNELGEPSMNLPARPWLVPGVRENGDKLAGLLMKVAKLAISGKASADTIDKALAIVGITAVNGIRSRIQEGLQPPLADATLRSRAYRGDMGAAWELSWRQAGVNLTDGELAKPLIDTSNFIKAISYVIADRRKGGA